MVFNIRQLNTSFQSLAKAYGTESKAVDIKWKTVADNLEQFLQQLDYIRQQIDKIQRLLTESFQQTLPEDKQTQATRQDLDDWIVALGKKLEALEDTSIPGLPADEKTSQNESAQPKQKLGLVEQLKEELKGNPKLEFLSSQCFMRVGLHDRGKCELGLILFEQYREMSHQKSISADQYYSPQLIRRILDESQLAVRNAELEPYCSRLPKLPAPESRNVNQKRQVALSWPAAFALVLRKHWKKILLIALVGAAFAVGIVATGGALAGVGVGVAFATLAGSSTAGGVLTAAGVGVGLGLLAHEKRPTFKKWWNKFVKWRDDSTQNTISVYTSCDSIRRRPRRKYTSTTGSSRNLLACLGQRKASDSQTIKAKDGNNRCFPNPFQCCKRGPAVVSEPYNDSELDSSSTPTP